MPTTQAYNNLDGADADVRSLAFLSRLTSALHASPFCSYLKCETFTGIGTFRHGVLIQIDLSLLCAKSDFHRDISALREQTVDQWREFVVATVLADYQKSSRHAQSNSDCESPGQTFLRGPIEPCTAPCQPSWSIMQALLSLSSHVHSVEAPSDPSRLQNPNIAMTTLGHYATSFVEVLANSQQASEERDQGAKVWDLKFLRRLLTLWTTNWDSISELDQLIEVCSSARSTIWIHLYPKPVVFQRL